MQPRPFAGQQVGLDDLSQQGVAQLVAVLVRPGHQQLVGDRGAQCLHQGLVFQAGDLGQEPVGDPPASHRHHCKDLPCQLGQRLDPATQQIPQRRWQLTGAGPDGPKQLLGEQRVALRTSEHRVDQVGGRRRPQNPDQLGHGLSPVQPGQLHALGAAAPVQDGQEGSQPVRARLVAAVAHHHQQPLAAQVADQEGQQVAGGAVGPVHVLDDSSSGVSSLSRASMPSSSSNTRA